MQFCCHHVLLQEKFLLMSYLPNWKFQSDGFSRAVTEDADAVSKVQIYVFRKNIIISQSTFLFSGVQLGGNNLSNSDAFSSFIL